MSTRVITPPSMDINRDMSQNCPDSSPNPPVVNIPSEEGGASLPESAGVPAITTSSLGCPSPAISPNSSGMMTMGPTTELILSTRIRTVPRCLFGPPDPHTAEFAREKVRQMREQDKRRYNFDFDAEEPLEGPFKWEAVPVASPSTTGSATTGSNTGSSYALKAYALSRFPYLSGAAHIDRGLISPPHPRTTINNNQRPPTRELYFEPDREPLLIARTTGEDRRPHYLSSTSTATATSATINRPISSSKPSPVTSSICQSSTNLSRPIPIVVDPTMLLPSPEASSCSSEDSANVVDMEMELGEDEDDAIASVGSSSTEDELKISNVLEAKSDESSVTATSASASATIIHHHSSSTSSGLSSRVCSSSSSSSISSTTSSRRTKSVSSSSSSPSASPSSPSSSQPPITKYMPSLRKRPASTSTTKAASESAPDSSAAGTEKKRAALYVERRRTKESKRMQRDEDMMLYCYCLLVALGRGDEVFLRIDFSSLIQS